MIKWAIWGLGFLFMAGGMTLYIKGINTFNNKLKMASAVLNGLSFLCSMIMIILHIMGK